MAQQSQNVWDLQNRLTSLVKQSRDRRSSHQLPFEGASGPAQDRMHKEALSNRLQSAEREIDDLQAAIYDVMTVLGVRWKSRTSTAFGVARATASAVIAVNTGSTLPAMESARLLFSSTQAGSITAISLGGTPLPVGVLDLSALDPTQGYRDAGYYLGDLEPGIALIVAGTLDVAGTWACWIEPDEMQSKVSEKVQRTSRG